MSERRASRDPQPGSRNALRPFRFLLGSAVVVFVALLATSWLASYRDLRKAHEREALLEERIHQTELRNGGLQERIERLRDDPLMLERLAREQLGLVREGELVIVFPEDEPAPAPILPTPER